MDGPASKAADRNTSSFRRRDAAYNRRFVMRWRLLSCAVLLLLGIMLWRIFFPAIMMVDSITQFDQAWRGDFNDWHPPLMAIVLHLFLKMGRNVGALTLLVCLSGLYGIRYLALAVLAAFQPALSTARRELVALAVVGGLFLPVSPLPFQLVTFWKDSWCAVALVWITGLVFRDLTARSDPAWRRRTRIVALLALTTALGLLRHNALIVLPAVGTALAVAHREGPRVVRAALLVAPLIAFGALASIVYRTFDVQPSHMERHLMALELVGVCARDRAACDELRHLRPYVRTDLLASRYVPGNMPMSLWTEPLVLDFSALWDGAALRSDFLRTALHHPLLLAEVDLAAFVPLLGLHGPHQFIWWPGIHPNVYGLAMTTTGKSFREPWARVVIAAGQSTVWRYVAGVHGAWLAANLAWIVALARLPLYRQVSLAFLPPLLFYLSYLPATAGRDYRYMYPSTLVLQVITLAAVLGWLAARVTRRQQAEIVLPHEASAAA
jgi:hypothetical protein